ncbi:PREDICTED: UPF0764 protein C16orf89 homolog [Elephantulus edwardii]|uniref:UPF0764 protein C16orf89 homolog n=1 Tax=Elephantulus edwardii TaxID=28737 RepID=UPI0003F07351|nr:PREDICTED: UPF0764 protein C16orf89 homolog [Elephantulus edwardii]
MKTPFCKCDNIDNPREQLNLYNTVECPQVRMTLWKHLTSWKQKGTMSTLKWLLLLLLLEASQLQPFFMSAPDNPGFKTTTEKLILSSMENATAFMEKNLQKTTLISILSLRAVEEVEPLIQSGFWKFPQTWTHTNASLVYQSFNSSDSSSQKHTAKCIAMLLGTRKKLFKHTQHYMDIFCSNMMDVNQKIEATGYANNTRDLFMKNIVLCGRGGYADFYKLQWLKYILSWQNPQKGCFGTASEYCF